MSGQFSVSQICERALRKIGAFSINDSGADGEELQEAAYWLDLNLAELSETEGCFWLRPDTVSATLTADQASYVLSTLLGPSYPTEGIVSVVSIQYDDGSNSQGLDPMRRSEYEGLSKKDTSGRPSHFYLDRLTDPDEQTLYLYPVPSVVGTLKMLLQVETPAVSDTQDNRVHGLRNGWQKFLITDLAAEIGDGPVRRLPSSEVDRMRRDAEIAFKKLSKINSSNTERSGHRRAKPWGA